MRFRSYSVLPGFGPTLGFSLLYLGLMVLLPISALVLFSVTNLSAGEFWQVVAHRASSPHSSSVFSPPCSPR